MSCCVSQSLLTHEVVLRHACGSGNVGCVTCLDVTFETDLVCVFDGPALGIKLVAGGVHATCHILTVTTETWV